MSDEDEQNVLGGTPHEFVAEGENAMSSYRRVERIWGRAIKKVTFPICFGHLTGRV